MHLKKYRQRMAYINQHRLRHSFQGGTVRMLRCLLSLRILRCKQRTLQSPPQQLIQHRNVLCSRYRRMRSRLGMCHRRDRRTGLVPRPRIGPLCTATHCDTRDHLYLWVPRLCTARRGKQRDVSCTRDWSSSLVPSTPIRLRHTWSMPDIWHRRLHPTMFHGHQVHTQSTRDLSLMFLLLPHLGPLGMCAT